MSPVVTVERNPGTLQTAQREPEIPREGPYRVVFERLQRLVRYRQQLLAVGEADAGFPHALAELARVRVMIREVHRAVSINPEAKLLAQAIDLGEPAMAPPAAAPAVRRPSAN